MPLASAFEHAVLVLRGSATAAGEALRLARCSISAATRSSVAMHLAADSQVLLLGGEPFGPAPLLWWNFVARTQAEIEQALADWNSGATRFGARAGAGSPRLVAPPLAGVRLKAGR